LIVRNNMAPFFYLDIIWAILLPILFVILALTKVICTNTLILYFYGVFLGYIWELTHALVPDFIHIKGAPVDSKWFIVGVYPLMHAIHDGLIFIIGLCLVFLLNINVTSLASLLVITSFGFGVAIIVELVFNGKQWEYDTNKPGNPVLFWNNNIGYTLWPWLEWIIAPILFWLGIILVIKLRGPCGLTR